MTENGDISIHLNKYSYIHSIRGCACQKQLSGFCCPDFLPLTETFMHAFVFKLHVHALSTENPGQPLARCPQKALGSPKLLQTTDYHPQMTPYPIKDRLSVRWPCTPYLRNHSCFEILFYEFILSSSSCYPSCVPFGHYAPFEKIFARYLKKYFS